MKIDLTKALSISLLSMALLSSIPSFAGGDKGNTKSNSDSSHSATTADFFAVTDYGTDTDEDDFVLVRTDHQTFTEASRSNSKSGSGSYSATNIVPPSTSNKIAPAHSGAATATTDSAAAPVYTAPKAAPATLPDVKSGDTTGPAGIAAAAGYADAASSYQPLHADTNLPAVPVAQSNLSFFRPRGWEKNVTIQEMLDLIQRKGENPGKALTPVELSTNALFSGWNNWQYQKKGTFNDMVGVKLLAFIREGKVAKQIVIQNHTESKLNLNWYVLVYIHLANIYWANYGTGIETLEISDIQLERPHLVTHENKLIEVPGDVFRRIFQHLYNLKKLILTRTGLECADFFDLDFSKIELIVDDKNCKTSAPVKVQTEEQIENEQ